MSARGIHLRGEHLNSMLSHSRAALPEEACGLLGGAGDQVEIVLPITNALHSPARFRMDAEEQVRALFHLEEQGKELVGIYHSHPFGPCVLSETDLNEAAYPGTPLLVLSAKGDEWSCRGFLVDGRRATEIPILIEESGRVRPRNLTGQQTGLRRADQ